MVQFILSDKSAAMVVGGIGVGLLATAGVMALFPPEFKAEEVKNLIQAIPGHDRLSFEDLHTLITEPIRAQLSKIFLLVGVGVACVVVAICSLNQAVYDLFFRIGRRLSNDLPGSGLILIIFVVLFSLVAIPIGYHPTSQFLLDLAKVGFGAFLAVFIQKKP